MIFFFVAFLGAICFWAAFRQIKIWNMVRGCLSAEAQLELIMFSLPVADEGVPLPQAAAYHWQYAGLTAYFQEL